MTVDPGGPSSKEYAIPLESARQSAAGTGSTAPRGPRTAPLFGVGIKAKSATKSASHRRSTRSGSATDKGGSGTRRAKSDGSAPSASAQLVRAGAPSGGFGSPATVGGLAVSVLLLGGVLGSIARRRRSS